MVMMILVFLWWCLVVLLVFFLMALSWFGRNARRIERRFGNDRVCKNEIFIYLFIDCLIFLYVVMYLFVCIVKSMKCKMYKRAISRRRNRVFRAFYSRFSCFLI